MQKSCNADRGKFNSQSMNACATTIQVQKKSKISLHTQCCNALYNFWHSIVNVIYLVSMYIIIPFIN